MNMNTGNAQVQRCNRAGQHFATIAQQQQKVRPLDLQQAGHPLQTFADTGCHAGPRACGHIDRHLATHRQPGSANVVDRVAVRSAQVHARDCNLHTQSRVACRLQ